MTVLFLASFFLLACSVRMQMELFDISDKSDRCIGYLVLGAANLVFGTLLLSELSGITPAGYLAVHSAVAALSYIALRMHREKRKAGTQRSYSPTSESNAVPSLPLPILWSCAVALACAAAVNLFLAVYVPPNNFDSMTYHLARVGFWLQNHSLHHFYTLDMRQVYSAPNAEILILWPMVFLHHDHLANVVQWLAYCGLGVLVYRTAMILGADKRSAFFAAFVYLCLPMVVLQSTSTQNDLVVTFFCLAAFYFFHRGLRNLNQSELVMSAISCGLALGTKGTFFFIAPALGVGSLFLAVHLKIKPVLYIRWFCFALAGMVLLGSYNYVLNYREFGNPLAPKSELFRKVEKRDVASVVKNAVSYGFMAAEFRGLPEVVTARLDRLKDDFGKRYLSKYLADKQFESIFAGNSSARYHEDHGWLGLVGFFVLLPLTLCLLVKSSPLARTDERWPYAFAAVFFFVFFCYQESYTPFKGRYFVLTFAFIAPLSACIPRISRPRFRIAVVSLVVVCSVFALFGATLKNARKPVLAEKNVFNASWYEQRALWGDSPETIPFMKFMEEVTMPGDRIGCVMRGDSWIYPFFGKDMSRIVLPIRPEEFEKFTNPQKQLYYVESGEPEVMVRYSLDFLVLPIAEERIGICPDPVFEHNYTVKHVRVVAREGWVPVVSSLVGRDPASQEARARKYYDIFSMAKNANVPQQLLKKELERLSAVK